MCRPWTQIPMSGDRTEVHNSAMMSVNLEISAALHRHETNFIHSIVAITRFRQFERDTHKMPSWTRHRHFRRTTVRMHVASSKVTIQRPLLLTCFSHDVILQQKGKHDYTCVHSYIIIHVIPNTFHIINEQCRGYTSTELKTTITYSSNNQPKN